MSIGLARCGVVYQHGGGEAHGTSDGGWIEVMGGCGWPIENGAHALRWPDDDEWILWHEECCPAAHPHVWMERPVVERLTRSEYRNRQIRQVAS
jgi:hypothetical protein